MRGQGRVVMDVLQRGENLSAHRIATSPTTVLISTTLFAIQQRDRQRSKRETERRDRIEFDGEGRQIPSESKSSRPFDGNSSLTSHCHQTTRCSRHSRHCTLHCRYLRRQPIPPQPRRTLCTTPHNHDQNDRDEPHDLPLAQEPVTTHLLRESYRPTKQLHPKVSNFSVASTPRATSQANTLLRHLEPPA